MSNPNEGFGSLEGYGPDLAYQPVPAAQHTSLPLHQQVPSVPRNYDQWLAQRDQEFLRDTESAVKQARDRAQYVRQQKGHSLVLHLLLGGLVLWVPAIYISLSPNHYWHA